MRMNPRCVSCMLQKKLNACPPDAAPETVAVYQDRVRELLREGESLSSPEVSWAIDEARRSLFGPLTDYAPVKRYFNALMRGREGALAAAVAEDADPLRRAVQYAMTGNFIDFAALDNVDEGQLNALLAAAEEIPIDAGMLAALRTETLAAKRLVYMTDNCGEIVLDKLLIHELRRLNPALDVAVMVRGAPVANDATREDAEQAGILEVARIIDSGCGIAGNPLNRLSDAARAEVDAADLLIAKGQANYEALSGCGRNLFYIFMCKCALFMERFGVPQFSGILTREPARATEG